MRYSLIFALGLPGCFADNETISDDVGLASSSGEEEGSASQSSTTTGSTTWGSSGGIDSGAQESSDEAGTEAGSTESDSGSDSSTGEPSSPYAPCAPDDESPCGPGEICIYGITSPEDPTIGFCSKTCNVPAECPAGVDGNGDQTCTYYYSELPLYCMLRCENGETCPTGMICHETFYAPETEGSYTFICA